MDVNVRARMSSSTATHTGILTKLCFGPTIQSSLFEPKSHLGASGQRLGRS